MKKWYVNIGIYHDQGIADVHLVIYARDAEDAEVAVRRLYPGAQIYYVSEEEPNA